MPPIIHNTVNLASIASRTIKFSRNNCKHIHGSVTTVRDLLVHIVRHHIIMPPIIHDTVNLASIGFRINKINISNFKN